MDEETLPVVTVPGTIEKMGSAARLEDAGERHDLEAGMAKYSPACTAHRWSSTPPASAAATGSPRSTKNERLHREAPMLLIVEGTADIQRMIIGRRLLEEYKLR